LKETAFRIDFAELPKAKLLREYQKSLFSKWVEFFTVQTYAELKALCEHDAILRQAQEGLEMVSKDTQIWSDARARWEGEFAINQEKIAIAKKYRAEGLAEGREEGREETLHKAAHGMVEAGISHQVICKVLQITEAELTELLKP
jgi:hypothetical protein